MGDAASEPNAGILSRKRSLNHGARRASHELSEPEQSPRLPYKWCGLEGWGRIAEWIEEEALERRPAPLPQLEQIAPALTIPF
jgi:hypothetical protein